MTKFYIVLQKNGDSMGTGAQTLLAWGLTLFYTMHNEKTLYNIPCNNVNLHSAAMLYSP